MRQTWPMKAEHEVNLDRKLGMRWICLDGLDMVLIWRNIVGSWDWIWSASQLRGVDCCAVVWSGHVKLTDDADCDVWRWSLREPGRGTSKEDLVGLCQRGYGEFSLSCEDDQDIGIIGDWKSRWLIQLYIENGH